MARLNNKSLFFTTSPRSPEKMFPEIQLLCEKFSAQPWNKITQEAFIDQLSKANFYKGIGSSKDKAFSARDRINRAPKALGFVDLKPKIKLTKAGQELIYGKRPQEVFLRQLLKFQLPSPFHSESQDTHGVFYIRPYLEIMRLVYDLEGISFDEFKMFAMQLTDFRKYDVVKNSVLDFRKKKKLYKGRYKLLVDKIWTEVIEQMYKEKIISGATKIRQSKDVSLKKFIKTKKGNMRDYTDACFRYLRFTGLFAFKKTSIIVSLDKVPEVEYLLQTVDRVPLFINDDESYKEYLFNPTKPILYTDTKENIIDSLMRIEPYTKQELSNLSTSELKDLRDVKVQEKRNAFVREQETQLKSYALYQEVVDTFNEIISDEIYDAPLFLEWNTWRAMTMINGGNIKGNFKVDDLGQPMSTAQGNMPDIECDYGDFILSVEVTLQSGQRQYEAEGEPVSRHYGQLRRRTGKDTYCLFIAPTVNPATLAHFFVTNQANIDYYGGKTQIVPLELDQFMKLIENSYSYTDHPKPKDIRTFLESVLSQIENSYNENDWRDKIQLCVEAWLVA